MSVTLATYNRVWNDFHSNFWTEIRELIDTGSYLSIKNAFFNKPLTYQLFMLLYVFKKSKKPFHESLKIREEIIRITKKIMIKTEFKFLDCDCHYGRDIYSAIINRNVLNGVKIETEKTNIICYQSGKKFDFTINFIKNLVNENYAIVYWDKDHFHIKFCIMLKDNDKYVFCLLINYTKDNKRYTVRQSNFYGMNYKSVDFYDINTHLPKPLENLILQYTGPLNTYNAEFNLFSPEYLQLDHKPEEIIPKVWDFTANNLNVSAYRIFAKSYFSEDSL